MEKCEYCGIVYHPMMYFSRPDKGRMITVCSDLIKETIGVDQTKCREKAKADGWVPRPELTPKR
jgi:hypothetical protein